MTLARLIEAVEAGLATGGPADALAVPKEQSDLIASVLGDDDELWSDFVEAHDGSLDAAKRLHDALLPGWRVVVRQRRGDEGGDWFVRVESADFHAVQWTAGDNTRTDILSGEDAVGIAPEAARAFLLAILRAMEGR